MKLLRTERQVALQDLHTGVMKSIHHYRDEAKVADKDEVSFMFQRIADKRELIAQQVAALVRESEDLPSLPDADKETVDQVLHRLQATFSSSKTRCLIQERLDAEIELTDWLTERMREHDGVEYLQLLRRLREDCDEARAELEAALDASA